MKLLIISGDHVEQHPDGGLTAQFATTRLRLLAAHNGFSAAGHPSWIMARWSVDKTIDHAVFKEADLVLFGKTWVDPYDIAQAAKAMGKKVIVDIADDLEATHQFGWMRKIAAISDAATVPSARMAERARAWLHPSTPVIQIDEPFEEPVAPPKARFDHPGPLELLWFGMGGNVLYLAPHLSEIADLAVDRSLRITLLSADTAQVREHCAGAPDIDGAPFRIRFAEWSRGRQTEALARSDIVLLPGDNERGAAIKSANRLVNTLAAGRLAVASPIPSYEAFSDNAILCEGLADGIATALSRSSIDLEAAIHAGQERVVRDFNAERIGRKWVETLAAQVSRAPPA